MVPQSATSQPNPSDLESRLNRLKLRRLGLADYEPVWRKMQAFTDARVESTQDELWLLQHPAVFTQGQSGKAEHLLAPGNISVVQVDRGGQVTYHGPGQIVAYVLIDIQRRKIGVRELVKRIEEAVIQVLQKYGVSGQRRKGAPGIYVDGAKIAALGLRVRRGNSFHGLAFNIDMDLEPFSRINPCGYEGLEVTQLCDFVKAEFADAESALIQQLVMQLGYSGTA